MTASAAAKVPEVLLVGCSGSGKTVLASLLKHTAAGADSKRKPVSKEKAKDGKEADDQPAVSFATSSTTGLNRTEITSKSGASFALLEVGGPMRSTWPSYFEGRAIVMFMLDRANRSQIATAGFELFNLLRSDKLTKTPVVVVLSKSDVEDCMSRHDLQSTIRLDDAVQSTPLAASAASSAGGGGGGAGAGGLQSQQSQQGRGAIAVHEVSSVTGAGVQALLDTIAQLLAGQRARAADATGSAAAAAAAGASGERKS